MSCFLLTVGLLLPLLRSGQVERLPAPTIHAYSFEQLSNSRYSIHSGFDDSLAPEVMANVLRAMSRVPCAGNGFRDLYVATPDHVYRYDPLNSRLVVHRTGDYRYYSGSAFEVGVAASRIEEAGMAIQAGLLAGTAFRPGVQGTNQEGWGVVGCPMRWATDHAAMMWKPGRPIQLVTAFGRARLGPLDTLCVARSSDSSLPVPFVVGPNQFESVVAGLTLDSSFSPVGLSLENTSQLLWAAYGVTPHLTYNRRQGLTVPSAAAGYALTGRLYVVSQDGVDRYHNRLPPGNNLATRDHRLERTAVGDRRPQLRDASSRIPASAPAYFVACVPDPEVEAAMLEVGFAGFQLLAQARALGLAGYLVHTLSRPEQQAIASALTLPEGHVPVLVFACGEDAAPRYPDNDSAGTVSIVRAQPAMRRGHLRVEYRLSRPGQVRVEVFDMLGRPVKLLLNEQQSSGYHAAVWDGTG
ncbi:hypothetical protein FJY70_06250, partial [candidate division WOR-3 bacterium]|nr:hypothetical protein [candidate division WOR-3 bacterium]